MLEPIRRPWRRRCTSALVALGAAAACAPEPTAEWFGAEVVELEALGEWSQTQPVVVEELPLDAEAVGGWRTNGVRPTAVSGASGEPASVDIPKPGRALSLTLPRRAEEPYNTVEVTVSTEGFLRFFVADGGSSTAANRSEYMERQAPLTPEVVRFSLPSEGSSGELTIFFNAMTHGTRVHSVTLSQRPEAASVPSPHEAPRMVAIGDRSRPSVGLLPDVSLVGTVVPRQGSRVLLYAASPSGREAEVRLSLGLEAGSQERSVKVGGAGWTRLELEAPPSALGAPCEVRVETTGGGAVVVSTLLHRGLPRWEDRPGTVLLVTSDTHRADHVGFTGGERGALTPALNALAARGTVFEDAISATSITNPSHASIFTGLPVRDTGVVGNVELLSERAVTLAETFQAAGYRTVAAVSARHLTPWRSGLGQGFEVFDSPSGGMTRDGKATAAAARELLADVGPDEDVFVWLHLFDVHAPYRSREGITERYYSGDPFSEALTRMDPRAVAKWNRKVRDAEYILALYKGEVTYLDGLLGELLEAEPRLDQGLVAFTSDHGEALGEIGLYWTHKGLYPSTLRVPLLLAGPGVPAGRTVRTPVENRSLARTLHQLALGEGGNPFPGRSLTDAEVMEDGLEEPRFVLGANALSAGAFAGRWYLLLHLETKGWGNPPGLPAHSMELYDLDEDPDALVDVSDEHPEALRKLRAGLVRWLVSADPSESLAGGAPTGSAVLEDVAALGYATEQASALDGRLIDPDCECPRCAPFR